MNTPKPGGRQNSLGMASLVFSLIAVAGAALIAVVSLTSYTPGDMVVYLSSVVSLTSWFASIGLGYTARRGPGRPLAMAGLVLSLVALIGFIAILNIAG